MMSAGVSWCFVWMVAGHATVWRVFDSGVGVGCAAAGTAGTAGTAVPAFAEHVTVAEARPAGDAVAVAAAGPRPAAAQPAQA